MRIGETMKNIIIDEMKKTLKDNGDGKDKKTKEKKEGVENSNKPDKEMAEKDMENFVYGRIFEIANEANILQKSLPSGELEKVSGYREYKTLKECSWDVVRFAEIVFNEYKEKYKDRGKDYILAETAKLVVNHKIRLEQYIARRGDFNTAWNAKQDNQEIVNDDKEKRVYNERKNLVHKEYSNEWDSGEGYDNVWGGEYRSAGYRYDKNGKLQELRSFRREGSEGEEWNPQEKKEYKKINFEYADGKISKISSKSLIYEFDSQNGFFSVKTDKKDVHSLWLDDLFEKVKIEKDEDLDIIYNDDGDIEKIEKKTLTKTTCFDGSKQEEEETTIYDRSKEQKSETELREMLEKIADDKDIKI